MQGSSNKDGSECGRPRKVQRSLKLEASDAKQNSTIHVVEQYSHITACNFAVPDECTNFIPVME